MIVVRSVVFIAGLLVVARTLVSVVRTLVLPRGARDRLSGLVFRSLRWLLNVVLLRVTTYEARDRVMAFYGPTALLLLLPMWLILVALGYTLMYWASGIDGVLENVLISGSSLLTLGFATGNNLFQTILVFSEATIGLMLVALLIAYLPTIYSAFERREMAVTLLEVRAGTPPSAVEMIIRFHRLHRLEKLGEMWTTWESWFADVEESHTTLAALVFFRSPQSDHSWVTASGAVLDAAALMRSTVDAPTDVQADLCIRAGYLALRRIAGYFGTPFNPDASFPADPISIAREEFEAACDELAAQGVPLKPDREEAWLGFAGWRVNYDTPLLALANLTMAPYAPWSSDRSLIIGSGKQPAKHV